MNVLCYHDPNSARRGTAVRAGRRRTAYSDSVPTTDAERLIPARIAITVFVVVVALIGLVLAVQFIPNAERPTIQQVPRTTTTTIVIPAPTSP
jgi:hypothetical protein